MKTPFGFELSSQAHFPGWRKKQLGSLTRVAISEFITRISRERYTQPVKKDDGFFVRFIYMPLWSNDTFWSVFCFIFFLSYLSQKRWLWWASRQEVFYAYRWCSKTVKFDCNLHLSCTCQWRMSISTLMFCLQNPRKDSHIINRSCENLLSSNLWL